MKKWFKNIFFSLFPCNETCLSKYRWYRKWHGGVWNLWLTDFCGRIWVHYGSVYVPQSSKLIKIENYNNHNNIEIDPLKNELMGIVSAQIGVSKNNIDTTSDLIDIGGDSLDYISIIMHVEEEFNVEIPDDKLSSLKSIDDMYDYLISKGVKIS
ncbi:MAG: acyl carrier protein [Synergistaceae bacterium]